MKKLIATFVLICWFYQTAGLCLRGKESFVLTSNGKMNALPYESYPGRNVSECVQKCRQDERCGSVIFYHNNSDTLCQLIDVKPRILQEIGVFPRQNGIYRFDKVCLEGACDKLFVIEKLPRVELEGHDNKMVENVTQTECMELCLTEDSFVCRSAEYDRSNSTCKLSRYDRFSRHTHFQTANSEDISYFDNICAYKPAEESNTAEIVLLGNVEHPYSLMEYRGVSVGECGELCIRNSLFPCRSFLFGRRSGQPFCGLTHQNRAGLFQSPGSFRPSSNLNYYEIARNLDACDMQDVQFELLPSSVLDVNPYKVTNNLAPQQCLSMCRAEAMCRSVNIDYKKGTCQYNADNLKSGPDAVLRDMESFNYFEKICLPDGSTCERDWAFERIRGKELVGHEYDRVLVEGNTKEECMAACLKYQLFQCRSAHFNYQLTECRLSPYSRYTSFDKKVSLENSRLVVDYFENNCYKEPRSFCNHKTSKKQAVAVADQIHFTDTMEECQEECYKSLGFNCRAYSYDSATRMCSLSHHNRKTMTRGGVTKLETSEFREVTACYDVTVECGQDVMRAKVSTNMLFNGKVYTKPKPSDCVMDLNNRLDFTLPILLTGCGTEREEEGKFSNVLVIQSNDQVVTASDKAVGVYCSYDIGNKTEEVTLNITTLDSSDQSRSSPSMPDVSMHVLDVRGKEKDSVSLGELLRVQVRMSDEDTYGIFIRNLVAKDGTGSNNLTLIDNTGCPVEVKMMREIRTLNPRSKSLESYLEAFTFTGSSLLELEAEVETCRESCKPVLCQIPTGRSEDDLETVSSFGKRRRRQATGDDGYEVLSRKTLTKSVAVRASQFGIGMPSYENSFAFPVTAPSAPIDKFVEEIIRKEESERGFCFEPVMSAIVGGSVLFVDVLVFIVCLIVSYKWRHPGKSEKQPLSIYYENSSDLTTG